MILLSSGCLCCSLRGDLVEALRDLIGAARQGRDRAVRKDRHRNERTWPIPPRSFTRIVGRRRARRALSHSPGWSTVVDAVNGAATLQQRRGIAPPGRAGRSARRSRRAICSTSRSGPRGSRPARKRFARSIPARRSSISPPANFAPPIWSPSILSMSLCARVGSAATRVRPSHIAPRSAPTACGCQDPVSAAAFALFLRLHRATLGPKLLRVKGLVALAEHPDEPLVIHGVQHVFHPPRRLKAWPDDDRSTRIVADRRWSRSCRRRQAMGRAVRRAADRCAGSRRACRQSRWRCRARRTVGLSAGID